MQKDDTDTAEQVQKLKEEIREMLVQTAAEPKQVINLIDDIQRSGIAYHFEAEIEAVLQRMNDIYDEFCGSNDVDDLHHVALCFRLLRQAGHNVSSSKLFYFPFLEENPFYSLNT